MRKRLHILAVILRAALLRGVSKNGRKRRRLWPILRGSSLRGEHLRMTPEFVEGPVHLH
jgi:hypothetical protein